MGIFGCTPRSKAAARETDDLPSSSVEIKNDGAKTPLPHAFMVFSA
jgi:hypothetical protein